MRASGGKILLIVLALAMVSACSRNKEPKLLNIAASKTGPDEFGRYFQVVQAD